jgi:hypothetical protein
LDSKTTLFWTPKQCRFAKNGVVVTIKFIYLFFKKRKFKKKKKKKKKEEEENRGVAGPKWGGWTTPFLANGWLEPPHGKSGGGRTFPHITRHLEGLNSTNQVTSMQIEKAITKGAYLSMCLKLSSQ